jgi:hypothetical protein
MLTTMQQAGGSIGTSALSVIALTATATYLAAYHRRARASDRGNPRLHVSEVGNDLIVRLSEPGIT